MKKIVFIILIIFIGGLLYLWQGIYLPLDSNSQEEKVFLIKKGEGVEEIAANLSEDGIIKNRIFFIFYVLLTNHSKDLKAGVYLLKPSMSVEEITDRIVSGKTIEEKITIIEGWNIENIADYFEKEGLFKKEEFFEIAGYPRVDYSKKKDLPPPPDFSEEYDFLADKPKNISLEGYLFPDTYFIKRNSTPKEIIEMMLSNFNKKLTPDLREEIIRQKKTIFEIVTMASLIEKEVKTPEDKKIVSGILWKRLKRDMPLQVDATISYITGKKTTAISREELKIDSPYNTYKYTGLPAGPICNPGIESILAAIYPQESEYFYYLSTPDGKTIFSRTLEEHNIAKIKYLR
ncbi:endolytic transglycosylase MltG [bacterium]|nr:endolytic transglycosylase MltG [bacterium]